MACKDWHGQGITLERFAGMVRFNYGSSVIVLLPSGVAELNPQLVAERPLRPGQKPATLTRNVVFRTVRYCHPGGRPASRQVG